VYIYAGHKTFLVTIFILAKAQSTYDDSILIQNYNKENIIHIGSYII
jgi:hypothetical protein